MPHPMTVAIQADLQKLADSAKAEPMQAYMKTKQPFYGVTAGPRRKSFKVVARQFKAISRADYEQIITELWAGPYREEMYQALELIDHYQAYRDQQSWPLYERLVRSAPHWDTLDWLAGGPISELVRRQRTFE
ncbi:MAG: DNA alkylation repair protein, partial [Anaerolineae bacterium]|nr:DNA alkylation repair protein [Anaerolineae bacterium]